METTIWGLGFLDNDKYYPYKGESNGKEHGKGNVNWDYVVGLGFRV